MIFTAAIVILISLKACMAQVATCKDDVDANIDCSNCYLDFVQSLFFVYKPPNVLNTQIIKSERNPTWANSRASIDQGAGHSIILTMAHYVQNNPRINAFAYSDDPPNLPPRNEKSKTKGVVLVDNGADAAAWFVHTASNFLAHLGGYSWPQSETTKGHMFLCLSLDKANLNLVGKAIRYQEPYIYANNLPPAILNQYMELSNLVNGVDVRITPFLMHAKFTTKAAHAVANIQAFGKHSKSFADMYARVLRNKFAANIRIWAPSDTRSKSICKGQYQLRKIASPMQFAGSQVSREADSAKWALVEGKNTICFTTYDYKMSEKQIAGAAICLENAGFFNSGATINNDAGHSIRRTMADFVANNGNINVLAYSDDPPNLPPMNEKSKAKGVLLVHNGATDAAAWFVHTAPNFLAHLGPYLWPAAETPKGHMFLCLSLNEAQLNSVAKAIRYQEPFIYANNLSPALLNLHNELSNLAKGVQIRVTPFLEHAKFTTKSANGAAANINAFGKHTKSFAGAAVCLENAGVYTAFTAAAFNGFAFCPFDFDELLINYSISVPHFCHTLLTYFSNSFFMNYLELCCAYFIIVNKFNMKWTSSKIKLNLISMYILIEICIQLFTLILAQRYLDRSLITTTKGIVSEISKVIQMLFTTAILILISLKTCMAQVATCKDDGDRDVDW
ncbi:Deoxyribonuclease-2-alpha [Trichinella sp. T8]|nr:Deoxyribonuclease-2-alpha [Trichinella sp. T8]